MFLSCVATQQKSSSRGSPMCVTTNFMSGNDVAAVSTSPMSKSSLAVFPGSNYTSTWERTCLDTKPVSAMLTKRAQSPGVGCAALRGLKLFSGTHAPEGRPLGPVEPLTAYLGSQGKPHQGGVIR